jgi:hypothetical protein
MAAFGLIMSVVTAYTAHALAVLKRSILTILSVATLAIGVEAEGVPQQIADLQAQITALKATVATLSSQLVAVRNNPVLGLGPFVKVDPNPENGVTGPNIVFSGANVHIVSGSGATDDRVTGKGNLIIGYNEAFSDLQPGDRGGSHNLVTGESNTFKSWAGVVFGSNNSLEGAFSSILGGSGNLTGIGGSPSVIVGGSNNSVVAPGSVVVGGGGNTCSGVISLVLGGFNNVADGGGSIVVSGFHNTAEVNTTILGGINIPPFSPGGNLQSGPITIVTPKP